MAYSQDLLNAYRAISVITLALSLYGSIHYAHNRFEPETPFTSYYILLVLFWVLMYIRQFGLTIATFIVNETRLETIIAVGWHFPVFNTLHYLWAESFINQYYILAELFLVFNLFNLIRMYSRHKTYTHAPLTDGYFLHFTIASIPLSWVIYALFWNGDVMFHLEDKLWARILANVFIWVFFVYGLAVLYWFRDFSAAGSTAYFMLAVGIRQVDTKLFGLQWIFAFVIFGVLLCLSVFVLIRRWGERSEPERDPLLGGGGV
ncbi:uncharacterized protein J8A68_005124 [[Candida] subhashii]|uniref:Uncharacterized protein n=1 Tax=[Candida] subhashii TaxID=561895 RepID=A0A8J5QFT0_9ASCO|nr:uncharacterized protein J8A68_005124 [[Candida] subhashii]KAG7661333.1 hypothetical protein J8A68_005124 [[Candida] subhashii]